MTNKKNVLTVALVFAILISCMTSVCAADATEEPYIIYVGNDGFYSDTNAAGDGWEYDAEQGLLDLYNYHGGSIVADGDLTIWTGGECVIQEDGYPGILCNGDLELSNIIGILTIYGGTSDSGHGYPAVSVTGVAGIESIPYAPITLIGGSCANEGYYGGDAVVASTAVFLGTGDVTVTGGTATAASEFGGYAVSADKVFIYSNGCFTGGIGTYASEAIYMRDECVISHSNVTVSASDAGISAFAGDGDLYVPYANFTRTDDFSSWSFTARNYTVTLDGAGGTLEDQAGFTHHAIFDIWNLSPERINLTEYAFVRPGYQFIGWGLPDGTLVDILEAYEPDFNPYDADNTNITLTAIWEATEPVVEVTNKTFTATIPDDWCEENGIRNVLFALYDDTGKHLLCDSAEWEVGSNIILALTHSDCSSYRVFFLDNNWAPVLSPLNSDKPQ